MLAITGKQASYIPPLKAFALPGTQLQPRELCPSAFVLVQYSVGDHLLGFSLLVSASVQALCRSRADTWAATAVIAFCRDIAGHLWGYRQHHGQHQVDPNCKVPRRGQSNYPKGVLPV